MNVREIITVVHIFVTTLMDHITVLVEMDIIILAMENVKVIILFTERRLIIQLLTHSQCISSNNFVVNFNGIFSYRY